MTRLLVLFLVVGTLFASSCIQSFYTMPTKTGSPHEDIERCFGNAKREAKIRVAWGKDSGLESHRMIRDRCKPNIPYESSAEENLHLFP